MHDKGQACNNRAPHTSQEQAHDLLGTCHSPVNDLIPNRPPAKAEALVSREPLHVRTCSSRACFLFLRRVKRRLSSKEHPN